MNSKKTELILNEIGKELIILRGSSKEENEQIKAILNEEIGLYKFKFDIKWLIGHGTLKSTTESSISDLIKKFKEEEIADKDEQLKALTSLANLKDNKTTKYICYETKNNVDIYHLSAVSALKCAVALLGRPEYVIILRVDKNVYEEYKKNPYNMKYTYTNDEETTTDETLVDQNTNQVENVAEDSSGNS